VVGLVGCWIRLESVVYAQSGDTRLASFDD
jgi:hypothetical protein